MNNLLIIKDYILNKYAHYFVLDKLLDVKKYVYNEDSSFIMFNQMQMFFSLEEEEKDYIDVYINFDENIRVFLNEYLFKNEIVFSVRHIPTRSGNILHEICFKTIDQNILITIINFIAKNYGDELNE